jgi:uncharacterized protein (DUF1499 family)
MLWIIVAILVAASAWVRLAPTDSAAWHVSPVTNATPDCTILTERSGARVACLLPGTPAEVLTRLDAIAMATPRTIRIAGSAEQGRITWVTRSLIWGFPDFTTAEATATDTDTRLDLHARLRFGGSDLGVNAARLQGWLTALRP